MFTTLTARRAAIICTALCLLFAVISLSAAMRKSATYDEPLHVATGWLNLWRGDFRLSPDVPPLWEYWIALPLGEHSLNFDAAAPTRGMDRRAIAALYQEPPALGVELVTRSRWMSLPLAMGLAALIAIWAGQLAGPVGAVAAMTVFVFDPNWLGHAPLAKNDVAFAFVYFAAAYSVWRVGRCITFPSLIAAVVLPAICLGTKMSGVIVAPVMLITLLSRPMLDTPWITDRRVCSLRARRSKFLRATGICITAAVVGYAVLWAQYRFRFDANLNVASMVNDLRDAEVRSKWQVDQPTPDQLAEWRPAMDTRIILWLERRRLVPQAWAAGFVYTQTSARERTAYLVGRVYPGGRLDYFPLAWLFKEPLAIISATLAAAIVGWRYRRWNWDVLSLAIPPGVYLLLALRGNVNIGLRHIFPVFPFMDVGIGLAVAKIWTIAPRRGRLALAVLCAALMIETLAAYPDFISFFNIAAGGERGGIALLGDSNLDWGQDLPLLKQWQAAHPTTTLYLDYFGVADPAAYGIRYINVPGGYVYGPPPRPAGPGVAAISATKLQRLFVVDPTHDFATAFEHQTPIAILGGSIYLFDYSPR